MYPPDNLPDGTSAAFRAESAKLANEFSEKGTVKHFALRCGFMPHDEADAEAILTRIIRENDWREEQMEVMCRQIEFLESQIPLV